MVTDILAVSPETVKILVVAPHTHRLAFKAQYKAKQLRYTYDLEEQFQPHLSMEDPPHIVKLFMSSVYKNVGKTFLQKLVEDLSLDLYRVEVLT